METNPLKPLLDALGALPALVDSIRGMEARLVQMEAAMRVKPQAKAEDGWLDAGDSAKYLAMSPGTFDKYRYSSEVKINGYKVGGKTLYKRTDLDLFVKLYALKCAGVA